MRPSSGILHRLAGVNWFIVAVMTAIAAAGLAMMVSAAGGAFHPWAAPQAARFAAAFALMMMLALLPLRTLMDYAYPAYFVCLAVLAGVDVAGHTGMGAKRWLNLGGFNLQPSEFMKLGVILALARYFHQLHPEDMRRLPFLIPAALLIALPAVLILRQPNLGTTLILVSVGGILCFLAGMRWRYVTGILALTPAAAVVAWQFMHDYQKRRVLTFLNPDQDPLGAGYNILQSMIAIGSGGLFGKGYLQGSQSQLNFLPEKHTDFIFTMLAEEWGFAGGFLLLLLYGALLMAGMMVAMRSRSAFGAMLAAGVTAMLFMHVLINCGMVMGMLPVVGVPLPLMSYGGSITVSTVLAIGLLLNAYANRDFLPLRQAPGIYSRLK